MARGTLGSPAVRVADPFLGRGVGRAILEFILSEAYSRGIRRLWLETGSSPAFTPALRLYESAGFVRCGAYPSGQHGRNGGLSVVVTGVDPRGRQTGGTGITVQLFSSSAPAVSGWRVALEVRISLEVAVGTVLTVE